MQPDTVDAAQVASAPPCLRSFSAGQFSAGQRVAGWLLVTEEEIIRFAAALPGVDVMTASEAAGAPEVAWGDSFIFYDPDRDIRADRRFPFATIVTKDYPGWDEASQVDRDGVFRLNVNVGRDRFAELTGHLPADHAKHESGFDYTAESRSTVDCK